MDYVNTQNKKVKNDNDPALWVMPNGVVMLPCKHGVNHPVGHLTNFDVQSMGVHGCDHCCIYWPPR